MKVSDLIPKVNCQYGAPMGRANIGQFPGGKIRVYDKRVPMIDGAYDAGGAYWGCGSELRVRFTKDLSYVEFYRNDNL